jgi:hypothetical protein
MGPERQQPGDRQQEQEGGNHDHPRQERAGAADVNGGTDRGDRAPVFSRGRRRTTVTSKQRSPSQADRMTVRLLAIAAALILLHLARSRLRRHRRRQLAVERRRALREQQWRAMIRDAGADPR